MEVFLGRTEKLTLCNLIICLISIDLPEYICG